MQEAQQRNLGGVALHEELGLVALAQGDMAALAKEDELAGAKPQGQYDLLLRNAGLAATRGQIRRFGELCSKTEDSAQKLGFTDGVVNTIAFEGLVKALVQDSREATAEADAVLKLSQAPPVLLLAADIYARTGDDAKAEKLTAQAAAERPEDQIVNFVTAPMIRGVIAMNHRDAAKALDLMKSAGPYEGNTPESFYTRASAFLMAGRGTEAVQEFQKVLEMKNNAPTDPFVALAQLGLARAYAVQGDKTKARTAYQDFLGAWKNADADLPLLKQAQAEYAKLQ
jgi:tetratricopeptide (TPR) repeat protein